MRESIRPDIVAQIGSSHDCEKIVMDTKWKIPGNGKPGDADLHQMHAYNVQFGASRSFLLYPRTDTKSDVRGKYSQGEALPSFDHTCGMVFLELFDDDNKLRRDLGQDLINILISTG